MADGPAAVTRKARVRVAAACVGEGARGGGVRWLQALFMSRWRAASLAASLAPRGRWRLSIPSPPALRRAGVRTRRAARAGRVGAGRRPGLW